MYNTREIFSNQVSSNYAKEV